MEKEFEFDNKGIDIVRVQRKLYEMGSYVADLFEKNNIPYMIAYGTLLGAVRHHGFVPWDDDFDLFLFEEDYERACDVLRNGLENKDFFLEDKHSEPLYFHGWVHVKDLNSEVCGASFPQDNYYKHKGVHVDLYRTHKIKEEDITDYLADEYLSYINRRKKGGTISDNEYEKRLNIIDEMRKDKQSRSSFQSKTVLAMDGPYKCRKMSLEDVFPLRKYKFENREFWGPNNYDSILKSIYGDYMTPPPFTERHPKCSAIIFKE